MGIRGWLTRAVIGGIVIAGFVLVPSAADAARQTYQYSFQEHQATDQFTDTGVCDDLEATITLTNYNEAFHVSATQAGLSKDEIEALLEDDPDGIIVKATYTQEGSAIVEDANGVTYSGHFASWFGFNAGSDHRLVFTGIFSFHVNGDDGSHVTGGFNSHATFVNGELVIEFDRGHVNGCPS